MSEGALIGVGTFWSGNVFVSSIVLSGFKTVFALS